MFGLEKFGDGIGLHRVLDFMAHAGLDPQHIAARALVVTGSNGKGSTARMCAALLETRGLRTGCFTSPHMFDLRERFLLDGEPIARGELDRLMRRVLAFSEERPHGDRIGAFEALFLAALLWYAETDAEAVVWEAGIGGRYDPVRALGAQHVALTSVELEHTQILGATTELIAYDKIDAAAPGGVVVLSPSITGNLLQRLRAYARLSKRTILPLSECGVIAHEIRNGPDGVRLRLEQSTAALSGCDLLVGLPGRHQIDNALTALVLARAFLGREDADLFALPNLQETAALAGVRCPGRLERVAHDPELWIDVGHTPRAVDLVTQSFLEFMPRDRILAVIGVSTAKDVRGIASIVAHRFERFILTRPRKGGADPASFADLFAGKDFTVEPEMSAAARLARERARQEALSVFAIGGLFHAAEFQTAWEGRDPEALDFL